MSRADEWTPDEGISPRIDTVFRTQVLPEIAPLIELKKETTEKDFWFAFAVILAVRYHPKLRKVPHRPPDPPELRYMKDVRILLDVARHLPRAKTLKNAWKLAGTTRTPFYDAKARQPELWERFKKDPVWAAYVREAIGGFT